MGELHLAKGRIIVHAKGYWFTSGGVKGAFGYYPHLKDKHGMPVYPDTQVHGDLRMAAEWLCKLKGDDGNLVNRVFGAVPTSEYRDKAGCIFITDLKPENGYSPIFQVKPRTEIDECRTNKNHMLVNFELAYLEGTTLESEVYVGYFEDEGTMNLAKQLLDDSTDLLSGFGAFRSRGYGSGRGGVTIKWEKDICVKEDQAADENLKEEFILFLELLVNFRNKEIEPGKGQLLDCRKYISSQQFRGWFVKAYNNLYGTWPSVEEMRAITFHDLYPSLLVGHDAHALGYPAPRSTIRFENGETVDRWGSTNGNDENGDDNQERGKPKPLSPNIFVTAETKPRFVVLQIEKRMRNSTEDNFATKDEGGLFAQEFVTRENVFGGRISIQKTQNDFLKKALFLLSHADVLPVINGCLFRKHIRNDEGGDTADTRKPCLVVSPVDYDGGLVGAFPDQITIASLQRYNVTLKRPRKNRIAIMAGSVLSWRKGDKTIQWSGFSKQLSLCDETAPETADLHIEKVKPAVSEMSRSQAGQLREFLSPGVTYAFLKQIISERLRKYKDWEKEKISKKLIPEPILGSIFTILNDESREESEKLKDAKVFIESVLAEHKLSEWNKSQARRTRIKFAKEAFKKGYAHD